MNSYDPTTTDWFKVMRRKNHFLVGLSFAYAETKELPKLFDITVNYYLFTTDKDMWTTYRSKEDFENIDNYFKNLILKNNTKLHSLAKLGIRYNNEAKEIIKNNKPWSKEQFKLEFDMYMKILFYGASVPWFVLQSYETLHSTEKEDHKAFLNEFGPLRGISIYPEYEQVIIQKYYDEIAKKHNIALELIRLITPWELEKIILDDAKPDKEELTKRLHCVCWYDNNTKQIRFNYDKEYWQKFPALKELKSSQSDSVKGTCAFKGKVTGKVRIIHDEEDCKEFIDGEILVGPSTNPNLMFAIKKAGAIVTDEGGITCHAAIVARELQKPCIIGTKHATMVFKTGDLIEVDAENGVVTKQ